MIIRRIEEICEKKSIEVVGKIPYDTEVNRAMRMEMAMTDYDPESKVAQEVTQIWNKVENAL